MRKYVPRRFRIFVGDPRSIDRWRFPRGRTVGARENRTSHGTALTAIGKRIHETLREIPLIELRSDSN